MTEARHDRSRPKPRTGLRLTSPRSGSRAAGTARGGRGLRGAVAAGTRRHVGSCLLGAACQAGMPGSPRPEPGKGPFADNSGRPDPARRSGPADRGCRTARRGPRTAWGSRGHAPPRAAASRCGRRCARIPRIRQAVATRSSSRASPRIRRPGMASAQCSISRLVGNSGVQAGALLAGRSEMPSWSARTGAGHGKSGSVPALLHPLRVRRPRCGGQVPRQAQGTCWPLRLRPSCR